MADLPSRKKLITFTAPVCAVLLSGCAALTELASIEALPDPARAGAPSALEARGPAAAQMEWLWWFMFWLGLAIFLAVMAYLFWALFRRRQEEGVPLTQRQEERIVIWGGGVFPTAVILLLVGLTISALGTIANPARQAAFTIMVTGYQWWWEVDYPDHDIRTANEIHIPVGEKVQINLTSNDVIHSFWIPQLHGKLDANPDRITSFSIEASEPGVYWGECAEFCGDQHAKMRFLVVAETADEFEAWANRMSRPIEAPEDPLAQEGLQVFMDAGCLACHRIAGTNATGQLGPDLTHVASRRTLGAGALENSIGNLSGWISDPHSIKPGVYMPASELSGPELQALLHFLGTLD